MSEHFGRWLALDRLRHQPRNGHKAGHKLCLLFGVDGAARACKAYREAGQHGQLARKRLGRGNANFRPRQSWRNDMAFPRDGRRRHVDDAQYVLAIVLGVAQRGQRICGFARLGHHDHKAVFLHRRLAVAKLRGHIYFDRQARVAFDPVFCDEPCIIGRAAGADRDACECLRVEGQIEGQRHPALRHIEVMGKRAAYNLWLFVNFLRHEVAMVALVNKVGRGLTALARAFDDGAGSVVKLRGIPRENHPVAVFQIGDRIGEGRESQSIGAEIHLAIAVAYRKRGALARANQQVIFALEDEPQSESAMQARE